MKYIRIAKFSDRKKTSICVCDTEKNIIYVIGYIKHNEQLFKEVLESVIYEENGKRYHFKFDEVKEDDKKSNR